jgi:hypothetical protein
MPLSAAARGLELLFGLSFLLQTLEHLRMDRAMAPSGLWPWHLQRRDVPNRYVRALLDQVFAPQVLHAQLLLRVVAVVVLVVQGSSLALVLFLFISQVLMLLRWRGAFNGGSDFMTLIVLTGMLIAQCMAQAGDPELGWRAGLWYISLQTVTSYFMSGWVKLLQPQWRNGEALVVFLNGAIYGPLPARHLLSRPLLARAAAWAFIVWECSFPLVFVGPLTALFFCATAVVFHFLVFWFFGLNRFFWAWLATFPAILGCASQGLL